MSKVGFKDSREFTSNAFRHGGAQELLKSGNSLEVIRGPGGWWGSGFRIYVAVEMDRAFRISRCLVAISGDSPSDDERVSRDPADKNGANNGEKLLLR